MPAWPRGKISEYWAENRNDPIVPAALVAARRSRLHRRSVPTAEFCHVGQLGHVGRVGQQFFLANMGEVVFCNTPAVAGGVALCRVGRAVAKRFFGDTKRKRLVERRFGATLLETLSPTASSNERRQDRGGRPAATIRPDAERRAVPTAAPPTGGRSIWQVRSMKVSDETIADVRSSRM